MSWIYVDLSNRDANGPFPARVEELSFAARLKSSLRWPPLFFLGAVLGAPIPVAHFVIVPSMLLLTVLSFTRQISKKHRFKDAFSVPCLKCGAPVPFKDEHVKWPLRFRCGHCWEAYRVEERA